MRQPAFALREVVVTKPLMRANAAHLEAVMREELTGTFFTMDLDRAQRALAQVPWVRNVALRRQWPHRLEVEVEEHAPLARWNDGIARERARRSVHRRLEGRAAAVRRAGWTRRGNDGAVPRVVRALGAARACE